MPAELHLDDRIAQLGISNESIFASSLYHCFFYLGRIEFKIVFKIVQIRGSQKDKAKLPQIYEQLPESGQNLVAN